MPTHALELKRRRKRHKDPQQAFLRLEGRKKRSFLSQSLSMREYLFLKKYPSIKNKEFLNKIGGNPNWIFTVPSKVGFIQAFWTSVGDVILQSSNVFRSHFDIPSSENDIFLRVNTFISDFMNQAGDRH